MKEFDILQSLTPGNLFRFCNGDPGVFIKLDGNGGVWPTPRPDDVVFAANIATGTVITCDGQWCYEPIAKDVE